MVHSYPCTYLLRRTIHIPACNQPRVLETMMNIISLDRQYETITISVVTLDPLQEGKLGSEQRINGKSLVLSLASFDVTYRNSGPIEGPMSASPNSLKTREFGLRLI
jgi:hypothetical protein